MRQFVTQVCFMQWFWLRNVHLHERHLYAFLFYPVWLGYRVLGKQGEGTFSEVFKCESKEDGETYAIKRMRQHFDELVDIVEFIFISTVCSLRRYAVASTCACVCTCACACWKFLTTYL